MAYHTNIDNAQSTLKNQTRAERRRIEKEQKKDVARIGPKMALAREEVFTLTREQLTEFILIERQNALNEVHNGWGESASKVFRSVLRIVLHDKFGFGEKRLKVVCDSIERQLDCIIEKCITVSEMEEAARVLNEKATYKR